MSARTLSLMLAAIFLAIAVPAQSPAQPLPAAATIAHFSAPAVVAPLPLENGHAADESAVRFYVSLRQTERVNAEIKRLKRLYPNWTVPDDLYRAVDPNAVDEEELWALYERDRVADLQEAIKGRMEWEPGWQPSRDLASKVARKELRLKILALAEAGNSNQILQLVDGLTLNPQTADIDVHWMVAKANANAKRMQQALAIGQSILASDVEPAVRLASVQKAIAHLPLADVETLLAMGKRDANGRGEFDSILIDVTRARITTYLRDRQAREIPPAHLQSFITYAKSAADPHQTALAAWYFYKRNDMREALDLFKRAMEKDGDATVAHGLALSLFHLGMRRESEEVAYAWRDPLVNNAMLYLDILAEDLTRDAPPMIEPERLARYGRLTMSRASDEGAQALAWYAFNSCQYDVALQWFERAMAWHPKRPTAVGYALTLDKLKKRARYVEVVNRYDGLFPELPGLVFNDNVQLYANACDSKVAREAVGALPSRSGAQGRTMADAAPRNVSVRDGYGRVASPGALSGSGPSGPRVTPHFNRKEFPVAVAPENDLRFATPGVVLPSTGGLLREPSTGPWPRVARRLAGVGPMPYEQYGFTLLPGWNGITTATLPPASSKIATAGTSWAAETTGGIGR